MDSMSRRRFLVGGAPVVALLIGSVPAWGANKRKKGPGKKAFYVLEPEYDDSASCRVPERRKGDGCHGCKACHKHAKNKMFPSRRAADRNRAHAGCKCKVVQGGKLDAEIWAALFGGLKNPKRAEVDLRARRTHKILARRARRG
jgi:hypothetical protein